MTKPVRVHPVAGGNVEVSGSAAMVIVADDTAHTLSIGTVRFRCGDHCPDEHRLVVLHEASKRTGEETRIGIRTAAAAMGVIGVLMEEYGFWTDEEFTFACELIERRREAQARQKAAADASAMQA